ncbi:uncharacterized protein LOC116500281 [Aythya fuligula]|uniref:Uncharacterized protein LOC116500281 n=1 Tax=Aythya fuligula TaxID=219594 RepID=A0A6J3EIB6_AYTFU|nr:uncharacterized protein LOC116500281 [Aythya fuligula]
MVIGLPGNALVLWSCAATRRRGIPMLLVFHLALADVATLLTGPVYIRFLSTGRWDLGLAACRGCNYICAAAMYASVFLIALLGLHRCLVVSRPSAAVVAGDRAAQLAHGAAAVTWLVALILATPSIAFRHVEDGHCKRKHSSTAWLVTHNLLETGLGWALPLTAVAAGYGLLLQRLRRTRLARRGRTLGLVAAVVVAFAVTWGPYHIASLLEVVAKLQKGNGPLNRVARAIRPPATALAFLSSALNPLLYACAGRGLCHTAGTSFLPRLLEGSTVFHSSLKVDVKMLVSSCLLCSSFVLACATIFFGFHVHKLDCAQFQVLGSDHPITATVGGDAVLPCHLSPRMNAEHMEVRWFRSRFSIYVHLYQSGQDHFSSQMPEYQGRTEFLKGGVSNGNVSLRILRTRLSDEGQYQCLIKDGNFYEEATLELKVAVSGSSPLLSVEDYQDGGIRVGCRAAGWYPKPEMLWRDFQGQQLPSFTESTSQDKNGFFQVEKTIIIHKNSKQNLSCSVQNTRLPQEKDSSIYISDAIFPEVSPWMVTFFAILAVCLALLIFLPLIFYRLQAKHTTELEKRSAEIRERDMEIQKHAAELRKFNPCSSPPS